MISEFLKQEMELDFLSDLKKEIEFLETIRGIGITKENIIKVIEFNDKMGKNISLFNLMSLKYKSKVISYYHLNTHMMTYRDYGSIELFIEPYFRDAPNGYYKTWCNMVDKYKEVILTAYSEYFETKFYDIYITDPRGLYR